MRPVLTLIRPRPGLRGCLALSLLFSAVPSAGQSGDALVKTQPSDFFWQLQDLDAQAPSGNPPFGYQNFTYCCFKAVNQSLTVEAGQLKFTNTNWIGLQNTTDLIDANLRGQFPCGAVYNGDPRGAPLVTVPYEFIVTDCPGWERSGQTDLNTWLQPLSGFLLPAVIFCLSVPRRRKIHLFRGLFVADIYGYRGLLPSIFGAIGALVLVTLDTVIWLCICFAFAGPMILSGLYEAMLDNRMLEFLRLKVDNQKLTLDMRCRPLMVTLIGNLDLALDETPADSEPQAAVSDAVFSSAPVVQLGKAVSFHCEAAMVPARKPEASCHPVHDPALTPGTPGRHIHRGDFEGGLMLQDMPSMQPPASLDNRSASSEATPLVGSVRDAASPHRLSFASPGLSKDQQEDEEIGSLYPAGRGSAQHLQASPWRHMEELLYGIRLYDDDDFRRKLSPRQWPKIIDGKEQEARIMTDKIKRQINKTKTRLRTMLQCKYSFGSVVGAPILFFLGGFVFALDQSLESLGDEGTALGLAFGQCIRILGLDFELAYPSCYKVAWQWQRGHDKKRWINKVIETYNLRTDINAQGHFKVDRDIDQLRTTMALAPIDWMLLITLTILLLGVPFLLAFLTAFFTPEVGLSCRSLNFLVYASVEYTQIALWLWAYAGPLPARTDSQDRRRRLDCFRRGGWLDSHGFYNPASLSWLLGPRDRRTFATVLGRCKANPWRVCWGLIYYFFAGTFGLIAVFAALGGTLMELLGVYSAGICYLTVNHWFEDPKHRPPIIISTNSAEMIRNAAKYWTSFAIAAILFMTVTSFVGWWYQRRMRDIFTKLVKRIYILENETDNPQMLKPSPNAAAAPATPAQATEHSPAAPSMLGCTPTLPHVATNNAL